MLKKKVLRGIGVADSLWSLRLGVKPMMGERRVAQEHLFYEFSLERHVPETHLLRSIDRFVELDGLRRELAPFYSEMGRPSIDPELLIRMLIVGYCFGIRSERRLCEEVHLNLAYRWFCRLGLDGSVPEHSSFAKNRHGRSRDRGRCRSDDRDPPGRTPRGEAHDRAFAGALRSRPRALDRRHRLRLSRDAELARP